MRYLFVVLGLFLGLKGYAQTNARKTGAAEQATASAGSLSVTDLPSASLFNREFMPVSIDLSGRKEAVTFPLPRAQFTAF